MWYRLIQWLLRSHVHASVGMDVLSYHNHVNDCGKIMNALKEGMKNA